MSKFGIAAAAVAAMLVAGGGLFLWKAKSAKERVVEPVVFASPDLFPPDTALFASIHDTEADWKELEDLRNKVESTALSMLALQGGPGGGPLEEMKKAWEKMSAEVETRLGRRPDAAAFFATFGGDLALGLAPLPKGGGLGGLLVTRLPDEAELARLKEHLGKSDKLRQRQVPPAHGYPVFLEEREGGGTLHYGLGGGHLFLSDDQALLDGAMANLAALAGAGADTMRPPSLASDAEFKAGVPGPWKEVRMAMFLRKGTSIGAKVEGLAPGGEEAGEQLDSLLARAFSALPGREAMAFSVSGASGARHWSASWGDFTRMGVAWEQRLPADLCLAWIPRPVGPGVREKAFGADFEALKGKRLWKEIDSLARDLPRLRLLIGEAMGPEAVPDDEILARIPSDLALLGEGGEWLLRSFVVGGDAPFCFAQKAFGEKELRTETVIAIDLDPLTAVSLAALADTAAAEFGSGGPVTWSRSRAEGPPTWSLDLSGMFRGDAADVPDPSLEMMRKSLEPWEPGLVLGNGTLYLTFGPSMRENIRGLCSGKAGPLSADPFFRDAMDAAEPGATEILFQRPGVMIRAGLQAFRGSMDALSGMDGMDEDGKAFMKAMLGALDEAAGWSGGMRVQITSALPEAERRSVTVTLLDPAAAAAPPVIVMGPGPVASPAALPAETFLLATSRLDLGPAGEAFAAAFLRGLEGGRERWDGMLKRGPGIEPGELDRPLEALVAGVKGEVGLAMAGPVPSVASDGPPSAGALAARLPSLVAWADFRDAGAAYGEAVKLMEKVHGMLDLGTFEEDVAAFEAGEGLPPFGMFLEKEESPAGPSTTLRMVWAWEPGGDYFVFRVGVLRRGDRVWFTASHRKPAEVAGLAGGEGTLAGRMKGALPAGAVPAEAMSLMIFREDGIADSLGALLDLAVPVGPSLTLMGLEDGPTPERTAAHEAGWREAMDLVKDAMRTGKWQVVTTSRAGDRWVTVRRRMGGK